MKWCGPSSNGPEGEMLETLSVQNFALIDRLDLSFTEGFNVLSGETGAGKSILIGALGLILGDKADTESVRTGSDTAQVSAMISIPAGSSAEKWLEERGLELEDGQVLIRRVVRANGRSSASVQSSPVTRNELRELSQLLVDVHGQHEHQSLLQRGAQRIMLDRYGSLEADVEEIGSIFSEMLLITKRLESLSRSERERIRERDMLSYAVEEIAAARLTPGEDEELEQQIAVASRYEELLGCLEASRLSLGKATDHLGQARKELSGASSIDSSIEAEALRIEQMHYDIEDVYDVLRKRLETVQLNPGEIDSLQERLFMIRKLEKKYGDTIEAVIAYGEDAAQRVEELDHTDENISMLQQRYGELSEELASRSLAVSSRRKEIAVELEQQITRNLQVLGMPHGTFRISVIDQVDEEGKLRFAATGQDRVSFEISPNKGEPLKPVGQIASGGEMSRIMLALKSVFAENDDIETLIFDEIDSGIGGTTASNVGLYLKRLGSSRQVICITHLATLASQADTHFVVDKTVAQGRTATLIKEIMGEERISELARMLSGDSDKDTALAHARELLVGSR